LNPRGSAARSRGQLRRRRFHPGLVVGVGEERAVRAAALLRPAGHDAVAGRAEDAGPAGQQPGQVGADEVLVVGRVEELDPLAREVEVDLSGAGGGRSVQDDADLVTAAHRDSVRVQVTIAASPPGMVGIYPVEGRAGATGGSTLVSVSSRVPVLLSSSSVFPEPTAAAFEMAATVGYDGLEVMVWTDRVSQDAGALRVSPSTTTCPVLSVHAPCLLVTQRVWSPDPWERLTRAAQLAETLGAPTVVVHPPFTWQRDYARNFVAGWPRRRPSTRTSRSRSKTCSR
jgi:hypothetical protein